MKKVLIIGGLGYVGSRLSQVLKENYTVDINDICWFDYSPDILDHDYHHLKSEDLESYDVIVVLGGHSSVNTCMGELKGPWLNNVTNFTNLLDKVRDDQLIIYASSASVYGNSTPGTKHTEKNKNFVPVNNYDVTKYALDQQSIIANLRGKKIIGLRFGTVNGWAPYIRTDVMINLMYYRFVTQDPIEVTNKHISRAILGIEDLCRAIKKCIENPVPGIYNLSSFNDTVENISNTVSSYLGARIQDKGKTKNAYDFSLDTTLFEETYDFKFQETTETILNSLVQQWETSKLGHRNNYIIYHQDEEHEIFRNRKC